MNKKILILGVGNVLLGDEGFGVHAMRYLAENYNWPENVRLIDGATLGLMLMGELMECDLAVILDIATADNAPGTFYEGDPDSLGSSLSLPPSMHQTGIKDVLISCDLAGHSPEVLLFCMEPYNYHIIRPRLTEEAEKRLPAFCDMVVSSLREIGVVAEAKF
ncbi:MAG: HyaD/HybD family hydrogenase maturation endopeptidase [Desulfovibrio sp.]|nr:HyaD/HybD family hydrogenase maturation endopeptidase [Desulfovibrio sp.]